uniref:Uncharacterized protein n=1 Tax=Plectus sambesii TaxID=2011161 RepID=A0A914XBH4_9BILA
MIDLSGKVSIITGSSSGIGQAAAVQFAQLGSIVVITGRRASNLEETKKLCLKHTSEDKILAIVGDLTDAAVIKRVRDETIAKFGKIDVLINNAGAGSMEDGLTASMEIFDYCMNINVRSVIQLTKACIPDLIASKGAIVMNSSILSSIAWPTSVYYGMTKAALDHYVRCLAVEYGQQGVRVNSVNPGIIKTSIFEASGMPQERIVEFMDAAAKDYPLRRVGESEDVARVMAFLASSAAGFVTGQHIHVDGGFNKSTPRHDLFFVE